MVEYSLQGRSKFVLGPLFGEDLMNKEHTKLKKLAVRTPEERQAAEQKRTTAVMGALKAVHSATSPDSMEPEDLERQRKGQELLGRLIAPMVGLSWEPFDLEGMPAAWSARSGATTNTVWFYTAMAAAIPAAIWAIPVFWPPSWPMSPDMRCSPLSIAWPPSTISPLRWRTSQRPGTT